MAVFQGIQYTPAHVVAHHIALQPYYNKVACLLLLKITAHEYEINLAAEACGLHEDGKMVELRVLTEKYYISLTLIERVC